MVEIRYGDQDVTAELAGKTIEDARRLFRTELNIPGKAIARLNGKRVPRVMEAETDIMDTDVISFTETKGKGLFMVGALLGALVVTGGVFAYGFTNASSTMNVVSAGGDFAGITANTTQVPTWQPFGQFKGAVPSGTLFDVNTATSNYTGDLVVTVSVANGDELVKAYRVLNMFIEMRDSSGAIVDVNADTVADAKDFAMLTLGNGSVDLYITQVQADTYTIKLKSGYYVSHAWGAGGWAGYENPILYAEVAQR
ncbi:MAG: hypothetical protein PHR56_06330 [Dehalococcoidales bacterium]|nr:hypothetical protein [Dehalococcoidales bacterium]